MATFDAPGLKGLKWGVNTLGFLIFHQDFGASLMSMLVIWLMESTSAHSVIKKFAGRNCRVRSAALLFPNKKNSVVPDSKTHVPKSLTICVQISLPKKFYTGRKCLQLLKLSKVIGEPLLLEYIVRKLFTDGIWNLQNFSKIKHQFPIPNMVMLWHDIWGLRELRNMWRFCSLWPEMAPKKKGFTIYATLESILFIFQSFNDLCIDEACIREMTETLTLLHIPWLTYLVFVGCPGEGVSCSEMFVFLCSV